MHSAPHLLLTRSPSWCRPPSSQRSHLSQVALVDCTLSQYNSAVYPCKMMHSVCREVQGKHAASIKWAAGCEGNRSLRGAMLR